MIVRIMVGVDGSKQAFVGAAWVARLPLTQTDEVTVAAVAQRPVLYSTWGYVVTPESDKLREAVG